MRIIIASFYALFILLNLEAQKDFKASFIFENAKGLTDTVWVVDTIDLPDSLLFLSDKDIDTNFSVYASDIFIAHTLWYENIDRPKYRSKYSFKKNDSIQMIGFDMICKDYPIKVKWDTSLFKDSMVYNSYLYNNFYLQTKLKSYPGNPPFFLRQSGIYNYFFDKDYSFGYKDTVLFKTGYITKLLVIIANKKDFIPISLPNNKNGLNISPNPAIDFLQLNSTFPMQSILILNTQGTILKCISEQSQECLIDISNLSPGLYFISVSDGNNSLIKKFVKL